MIQKHRWYFFPTFIQLTVYLTIIPRGRVGYEMVNSQRGAQRRVGYNYLISNKREWNNCFIKNPHKISLNFVRTNRKRQGTSAIHMSQVYQNCQRANGLNEKSKHCSDELFFLKKTHRNSRNLHSRTAKKPGR